MPENKGGAVKDAQAPVANTLSIRDVSQRMNRIYNDVAWTDLHAQGKLDNHKNSLDKDLDFGPPEKLALANGICEEFKEFGIRVSAEEVERCSTIHHVLMLVWDKLNHRESPTWTGW